MNRVMSALASIFALYLASLDSLAVTECPAVCGTTVPPGFVVNQTWTAAGSPYCITGDIQVSLLTIEPGVCVLVDGPFQIEVLSIMTAVGTAAQPIVFTAKDPLVPWKGLRYQDNPPGSQLVYCEISNSDNSGIRLINTTPVIDNCTITGNTTTGTGGGIDASILAGSLTISNSTLSGNQAGSAGGGISALITTGNLTIQNSSLDGNVAGGGGGGISTLITTGNITIDNCSVVGNQAVGQGGGMEATIATTGDVTILNSIIDGNESTGSHAGGLTAGISTGDLVMRGCTVSNNQARLNGGGIIAGMGSGTLRLLDRCIITNNISNPGVFSGNYRGGGIYIDGAAELIDCLVSNNTCNSGNSKAWGGGIFSNTGSMVITNCMIRGNVCQSPSQNVGGGAILLSGNLSMTNSIVTCNTLIGGIDHRGGGIFLGDLPAGIPNGDVVNCTITNNDAEGMWLQPGGSLNFLNTIVYFNNNDGEQITNLTSANFCNIQGGVFGDPVVNHNISFNPVFAGGGCCRDNYTLIPGSPCIDGGDPNPVYNDVCFTPSVFNTAINDMGARGGPGACNWISLYCPGDVTPAGGNGVVNIDDLVAILNGFGTCTNCVVDISPCGSGNGTVNIDDLVAVLNGFGPCQ